MTLAKCADFLSASFRSIATGSPFTSSLSRRRIASCCAAPSKSCAFSELQFPSLKGLSPPAIAASRGEQPGNVEAWLEGLADSLAENDAEVEGRAVTSITP